MRGFAVFCLAIFATSSVALAVDYDKVLAIESDHAVALNGRAWDGNNSPYAEALLGLLDRPGLEISMLFRRVRDDVKSNTGGQQEPFTYGSLPADPLYFRSAAN